VLTVTGRSILTALLWTSAGLSCVAAAADRPNDAEGRWYGSLGIGWNYADRIEIEEIGGVIDYDFGLPAATLALGWAPPGQWRAELEFYYQENKPEVLFFPDSGPELDTRESDKVSTASLMLSALRDFDLGIAFRPYLGFGIGPSRVATKFNAVLEDGETETVFNDENWAVAWQAMAGVTVPVSRRLQLAVEYRYWRASSFGLEDLAGNDLDGGYAIQSGWLKLNYRPGGYAWRPETVANHPNPGGRNFYLAGSLGGGWAPDRDLIGTQGQLDAFSIGPMGSIAVGYRFGRRWMLEIEAARRSNDMQIFDTFFEEARTTGEVRADSLMINAMYRFRPDAAVNPYLGAGVGAAERRYRLDLAADGTELIRAKDSAYAVQLLAGFDVALTPRWTVTVDYHGWFGGKVAITPAGFPTVDVTHLVHGMSAGLRYEIGQ
jgi:opacity protein-like surface antigen